MELTEKTPLPIDNQYGTPKTLGKDRIAAVMGAYRLFPNQNCLVIDAGTCITYDLLTKHKTYLGGNISPGIDMRLKAMHQFTAKLPLVERGQQERIWGTSTETALRNGGQFGALYELEAFIRVCKEKFDPLTVVLTGGDGNFFAENLKTKIFARPNLVEWGLLEIFQFSKS